MAVEPTVTPHQIELKKSPGTLYEEGRASASITPGMLLERTPGTNGDEVQPHSVPGGRGETLFAREDALRGFTIDDAYSNDPEGDGSVPADVVPYGIYLPGDEVYALLAANQVISDGDLLVSNGAGALKALTAGTGDSEYVIAEAKEDVTTTGSVGRVKCRIVPQSAA